ncbi:MAG: hypothetical protein ACM3VS_18610 [Candidatus Dadabacteria bacterium]
MKTGYIIAAALAVAGAVAYFLLRRNKVEEDLSMVENRAHHLTDAFSKAKERALNM